MKSPCRASTPIINFNPFNHRGHRGTLRNKEFLGAFCG
jgi:hypothetical protein